MSDRIIPPRLSRRTLVRGALAGGAVAASGVVVGCAIEPAPFIDAVVDDDPSSPGYGRVALEMARYPDLAPVGGALTVRLQDLPFDPVRRFTPTPAVLLIHRAPAFDPPEYVAVDSACTHLGCPLGYLPASDQIACPCHASRFRAAPDPNEAGTCPGDVLHVPAKQGLRNYRVVAIGGVLTIDLRVPGCRKKMDPPVVNGTVTLPLSDYPELADVGGSAVIQPENFDTSIIVVRRDASTLEALSAICSHLGCTVEYDRPDDEIECPCHGSRYDFTGAVLNGPARTNLTRYTAQVVGQSVVVTVG
jgi:Rieske Fe-S protein